MRRILEISAVIAALMGILILLSINHQRMMKVAQRSQQVGATSAGAATAPSQGAGEKPAASSLQEIRAQSAPSLQSHACNIETLGGTAYQGAYSAVRGAHIKVGGWLLDAERGNVPSNVVLRLDHTGDSSSWQLPVAMTIDRADVAASHGGGEGLKKSGFEATIDSTTLPSGGFHLYLVYSADGRTYACDNQRALRLGAQ